MKNIVTRHYEKSIFKKVVNNITDDVNLFYIFCDSKIKLFNLLMERYLGTVEYDRIFVNRESFFVNSERIRLLKMLRAIKFNVPYLDNNDYYNFNSSEINNLIDNKSPNFPQKDLIHLKRLVRILGKECLLEYKLNNKFNINK